MSNVKVMRRVDDESIKVAVVGDATHFISNFASSRADTLHFVGTSPAESETLRARFQSFLNGNLKSNGIKTSVFAQRGIPFKWQLAEGSPADLNVSLPAVPQPSPFAPPMQVYSICVY